MTRVALIVAALVALAAGCGEGTVAGEEGSEGVDGKTNVSTSVTGHELVPDTQVRLTFRDEQISANAGCNHLAGTFTIDGRRLRVEDMGGTEMGCPPERHAQDEWLMEFLTSGPVLDTDGAVLTLRSGTTTITLVDRETAEPDLALEGPRWVADTIIEGDTASSVPQSVEAWVRFVGEAAEGSDGCNGFTAGVHIDNEAATITFDDRISTLKGCAEQVMRVADAVMHVTTGEVDYEIESNRLTLTADDGAAVSFTAERD